MRRNLKTLILEKIQVDEKNISFLCKVKDLHNSEIELNKSYTDFWMNLVHYPKDIFVIFTMIKKKLKIKNMDQQWYWKINDWLLKIRYWWSSDGIVKINTEELMVPENFYLEKIFIIDTMYLTIRKTKVSHELVLWIKNYISQSTTINWNYNQLKLQSTNNQLNYIQCDGPNELTNQSYRWHKRNHLFWGRCQISTK